MTRYFRQFKHLVPRSDAWSLIVEKALRKFFEGLALNTEFAVQYVDDVYLDLFPQTTRALEEWEEQFALPATGTEQERRDALAGRWAATGGQSPRYLQDVMQARGFDVYIHEWWGDDAFSASIGFFSFTTQDTSPQDFAFSGAGDRLFMLGGANDAIFEYHLNKSLTLSQLSYANKSASIATQEAAPTGIAVSRDGSKLFLIGGNATIYEYDFGNDVDGLSYTGNSLSVAAQEASPSDITISEDGTKIFVVGISGSVYEYDLATANTVVGASYSGDSLNVSALDNAPSAISFDQGGTVLYVNGDQNDEIYKFALSTAYALSTATDTGKTLPLNLNLTTGIFFYGRTVWAVEAGTGFLFEVPLERTVRNPRTYTNNALLGTVQCGDGGTAPNTETAECGESKAQCNLFLVNEVGYIVNLGLDDKIVPPRIPDDTSTDAYFLYWGGETFPDNAVILPSLRDDLERTLLQYNPAQQWLVTLITYAEPSSGDVELSLLL